MISSETVSPNATLKVGPITLYDTFLASLFLLDVGSDNPFMTEKESWNRLEALYPYSFLTTLKYRLPDNQVKEFRLQKPVFQFDSDQESTYLKIFKLLLVDDKEFTETQRFINSIKEPWMTETIRKVLLKQLKNLS